LKKILNYFIKGFYLFPIVIRDYHSVKRKKRFENSAKQIIIIKSGTFKNRGDQAMIFTAVSYLKKLFPQKEIIVATGQRTINASYLDFNFQVVLWNNDFKYFAITGQKRGTRKKISDSIEESNIKQNVAILKKTYAVFDISGYSLSSQQGFSNSVNYIMTIMMAKRFKIPYYILPQSIGPFGFSFFQKMILKPLLKIYLNYPLKLFVREKESLKWLKPYRIENTFYNPDIVFFQSDYDLSLLYKKKVYIKRFEIQPFSIGIIPNQNVFKILTPVKFYALYKEIVNWILKENIGKVYIVKHSEHDLEICQEIFLNTGDKKSKVEIISEDLNCIELEYIFSQFKFVIASRYHSIVQSLKNQVPAVVIGWALKYKELMALFDQSGYLVDCREKLDIEKIRQMIEIMQNQYQNEKIKIKKTLRKITRGSFYEELIKVDEDDSVF